MKQAWKYIVLVCSVSWLAALAAWTAGINLRSGPGLAFSVFYMFFPFLGAVVMSRMGGERVRRATAFNWSFNRWWVVGWLAFPVLAVCTLGVSLLIPGISWSPGMEGMFERFAKMLTPEQMEKMRASVPPIHPFWLALGQGLFAGLTINAVAGFGEEAGWRGYLYGKLVRLGFWKSSLLTGLVWGTWHFPFILQGHNFPDHRVAGVFMMVAGCALLSPLMALVRLKSGSSVAAAVAHGTLNATYGLSIMMVKGGSDLTTGIFGAPGLAVLALANLAVFALFGRPRIAR